MRPELPEGYYVRFRHRRIVVGGPFYVDEINVDGYTLGRPAAKGGETEARVYGPDDSLIAVGVATCHARDNFNRRIGRDIALGRALKQLHGRATV